MSENVIEINEENLKKELFEYKDYSVVDFWAPWCGPCRMMAPIFEELANEIKNVKFCKVDVDKNQNIAANYRISSIPCFIIFKDGKAIVSKTGGSSKDDFKDWIEQNTK